MGTYTTNKNLFMPSVGETGWGELVNGNFETIDNLLKPITVSGSTYTFTGTHVGNQSGGSISATTGTFSGTVTAPTFSGNLTGNASTATSLKERVLKFSNAGFQIGRDARGVFILPVIPGILYSGTISGSGGTNWSANIIYKRKGGAWTGHNLASGALTFSDFVGAIYNIAHNGNVNQVRVDGW